MALFSIFKRKDAAPREAAPTTGAPALDESVAPEQRARTQARRRLIGSVVLLALGVMLFPLVFETQPRPMPADIPLEMPHRDLTVTRQAPARQAPAPVPPVAEPVAPAPAPAIAVAPAMPEASAPAAEPDRLAAASAPDAATPRAPASAAPAAAAAERPAKAASAPRASPAAAASEARAGRFVVQVGAYTDAGTLRDVRAKVEKLGLKTYTQAVETEQGTRTRVRVGPFATRQEAEAASTRLKGAGLPGNVLVL